MDSKEDSLERWSNQKTTEKNKGKKRLSSSGWENWAAARMILSMGFNYQAVSFAHLSKTVTLTLKKLVKPLVQDGKLEATLAILKHQISSHYLL